MMENLKKLLSEEAHYQLRDEVMDRFLSSMTEVNLKNKETLISYGQLNTDIYILKKGILRLIYFNGDDERTYAFALPGTMVISMHAYYMHQPSFMQIEACTKSTVLKISKREFDELMEESHEFARWIADVSLQQLYFLELKLSIINGTARDRFLSLAKTRPEIMKKVSMKIIASYLGVTPAYLSRLKNQLLRPDSL